MNQTTQYTPKLKHLIIWAIITTIWLPVWIHWCFFGCGWSFMPFGAVLQLDKINSYSYLTLLYFLVALVSFTSLKRTWPSSKKFGIALLLTTVILSVLNYLIVPLFAKV